MRVERPTFILRHSSSWLLSDPQSKYVRSANHDLSNNNNPPPNDRSWRQPRVAASTVGRGNDCFIGRESRWWRGSAGDGGGRGRRNEAEDAMTGRWMAGTPAAKFPFSRQIMNSQLNHTNLKSQISNNFKLTVEATSSGYLGKKTNPDEQTAAALVPIPRDRRGFE